MIIYLDLRATKNRSYFPKKTGISKILSPYTILKRKHIYFSKNFLHYFGEYVQVKEDSPPKKNNLPISLDYIYIRALESLQRGHKLMDLATGSIITRPKGTACTMNQMEIERVKLIAERQGYNKLKFFNRARKEMILQDADQLA